MASDRIVSVQRARAITARAVLVGVIVAGAIVPASIAPAMAQNYQAMSCTELWRQRAAIMKRLGFCFTDARGVAAFGNDGCKVQDPNALAYTPQDRDRIAQITLNERMKLCR